MMKRESCMSFFPPIRSWSLFQLFHTLVPPYVTPPSEEGQEACTLDDFVHAGAGGAAADGDGL